MNTINELNDIAFEVEFMNCVVDKSDNLRVVESDSHFSEFTGVHSSKINQGKLYLHDIIMPKEREIVMRALCKKNSPFVYLEFHLKSKKDKYVSLYCTGQNDTDGSLCRLTLADVSRSVAKSEKLKAHANEMNHLIDLVTGGVCLFKVNSNMHIEALYLNESCCRFFGTTKDKYSSQAYRLDELIHHEDKSLVFQAIGGSMATKKPIDMEVRIMTHKDAYMWCKFNAAIQRYDDDNCPVFHAMFSDITKIKEAEARADRQSELLVKILKNLPGPIFCTSLDELFKLEIASSDFMKLTGYTRKELFGHLGGDLRNLMTQREIAIASHALRQQSESSTTMKATYSVRTKSGKYIIVSDKRRIIESDTGEKKTIGLLTDITSKHTDTSFDM